MGVDVGAMLRVARRLLLVLEDANAAPGCHVKRNATNRPREDERTYREQNTNK
jgi:hypothetical protein